MSHDDDERQATGNASGWSVHLHHDGRWQWSAYSRGGSTYGWALSKAEAEQRARTEAEHLKRAFPRPPGWAARPSRTVAP